MQKELRNQYKASTGKTWKVIGSTATPKLSYCVFLEDELEALQEIKRRYQKEQIEKKQWEDEMEFGYSTSFGNKLKHLFERPNN